MISFSSFSLASNTIINTKANKIASKDSSLSPTVAKLAIEAFYKAEKMGVPIKKHIITAIDYSLPSTHQRLWVIDLKKDKVIHKSLVAHGKHSGENYTNNVSNKIGSLQTSLGVFLTQETYFGKDGYSLRLQGLEKGFNENARTRTIVLHGAKYVSKKFIATAGRIGRSWGCPAVEPPLAKPIINTIKNGSLIFSYFPDNNWLNNSIFIGEKA